MPVAVRKAFLVLRPKAIPPHSACDMKSMLFLSIQASLYPLPQYFSAATYMFRTHVLTALHYIRWKIFHLLRYYNKKVKIAELLISCQYLQNFKSPYLLRRAADFADQNRFRSLDISAGQCDPSIGTDIPFLTKMQ
jgi:hypothetical protein